MITEYLDCPVCDSPNEVSFESGDKTWRGDDALHEWVCEVCGATVVTTIHATTVYEYYLEDFKEKEQSA